MKAKLTILTIIMIISIITLSRISEETQNNIISNNSTRSKTSTNSNAKIKYDFNIRFPRSQPSIVNIYELSEKKLNIVDARIYGGLFDYKTDCIETENSFYFEDNNTILTISKKNGLISYQNKQIDNKHDIKITAEEAKEKSERFIKEKYKSLYYEEAEIELNSSGNEYKVKFINSLENKKNYAYNTTVYLDIYGNIKRADYYKNGYIKKASAKIITMQKAAELLITEATDIVRGAFIDIKKAEIIYILDNDLIVPAYLFKGELAGGAIFEQIVPAMKN